MRIALFGGTFDPPHRGHLAIATAAADTFHLDKILFAPAGRQPLKPESHPTPFQDRLAMTTLACAHDPRFEASTLDAPHPDGTPNYTVDTLEALHRLYPPHHPDTTLFNLAGADSFLDLPRWHESGRLLDLAQWIVVSRPGFDLQNLDNLNLTPHQRSRIHLLQTVHEDLSATHLRERLRAGDPCTAELPPAVSTYVLARHLYIV